MKRHPPQAALKRASEASTLLRLHLEELNVWHKAEFRFCPTRRWRFDFAIATGKPGGMYGIEIEGGAFTRGRHTRGVGFIKDMEKYNHAVLKGWRILRFTPIQVLDGTAIAFIKRVLESSDEGGLADVG